MTIFGWMISACWAILVGYWCTSAVAVWRTGRKWIWWREIALRLGFFALVVLALQSEVAAHVLPGAGRYILSTGTFMGFSGFVLCIMGVGLTISARASLGLGWATPLSSQEQRKLLTTGPYAFARHPMYGGLLLAMLGSAIGQSVLWLLPLVVYGPGFVVSARREESLLIEQFAGRYRDYMRQTRMFVPFLI